MNNLKIERQWIVYYMTLGFIFVFGLLLISSAQASELVHKFGSPSFNGMNQSAHYLTIDEQERTRRKQIEDDIADAIERIDMGIKHKRHMTEHERRMVAYHETGHLLVLYILHPTNDVFKASIVGRRAALGVVHHQPREELFTHSKDKMLADIKVALGGYVAEKTKFGVTSSGVGGGPDSDFHQAMSLAHSMVWKYGMGESAILGDYTMIPDTQLSEAVKKKLNEETGAIIDKCAREVEALIKKESEIFEYIANELLKRDELDYDEIEEIFKKFGKSQTKT